MTWSSPRAVPRVPTTLQSPTWCAAITSVYPSTTATQPASRAAARARSAAYRSLPLLEERRLGAVQVFCDTFARRGEQSLDFRQNPPAKPDRPAPGRHGSGTSGGPRNRSRDQPRRRRRVARPGRPSPEGRPGTLALRPRGQPAALARGVTQPEPLTLAASSSPRDGHVRPGRLERPVPRRKPTRPRRRPPADRSSRAPGAADASAGRRLKRDTRPLGQHPQRLGKFDTFIILDKIKYVAARAATPAFERLAVGVQLQRRVVVVVERTERLVLGTGAVKQAGSRRPSATISTAFLMAARVDSECRGTGGS